MYKKIIIVSLSVFFLSNCAKDNFRERYPIVVSNCDTTAVMSYSTHIKPVLDNNCTANCHNGVGTGASLLTWANVTTTYGTAKIISAITWDGTAQQMPKGATSKISICDIAKIKKWVVAGAPNN